MMAFKVPFFISFNSILSISARTFPFLLAGLKGVASLILPLYYSIRINIIEKDKLCICSFAGVYYVTHDNRPISLPYFIIIRYSNQ